MFQIRFVLCAKKRNVFLLRVYHLLQRAHSISTGVLSRLTMNFGNISDIWNLIIIINSS